jgi:6-phosphogluconolactonase/glucosamine-6-phosphate isomerase/deaminase
MEIFKQNDAISVAAECGEYLNACLIENKKTPVLLMLSGGSALTVLDYLGDHALGENITVSVLDERFSGDTNINNFAQLQKTEFYTAALNAEVSFFGTLPRPNESADELAKRLERNLKTWKDENSGGLIVATLGMGADGHTAGIFPFDDKNEFNELFNSGAWTVSYNALGKHQYPERITTTLNFLRNIDFGFAYVCGTDKKEKFQQVQNNESELNLLPALAWHDIGDVKVFTDIN